MVIPDSRVGRRLLPEGWDVIDDPISNPSLDGSYIYDDQGVVAQKVHVVENGVVKNFNDSYTERSEIGNKYGTRKNPEKQKSGSHA